MKRIVTMVKNVPVVIIVSAFELTEGNETQNDHCKRSDEHGDEAADVFRCILCGLFLSGVVGKQSSQRR